MKSAKKKTLTAFEWTVVFGAETDFRVSERFKNAADTELSRREYKGLAPNLASIRAYRKLALNDPSAFDPTNKYDRLVQKVWPLMYTSEGSRLEGQAFFDQFDMSDITISYAAQEDGVWMEISIKDFDGSRKSVRYNAPLKPGLHEDLPLFGVIDCE